MLGRVACRGLLARAGPGQGCVRVHAATTHLEHAAGLDTSQHEDTFLAVYRLDVTVRAKLVTWVGAGVKGFWGRGRGRVRVRVGVRVRARVRVWEWVNESAGASARVQLRSARRACASERARITDAHSREVRLGVGLGRRHDEPRAAFARRVPQAVFAPPLVPPFLDRRLDLQLELEHGRPRLDCELARLQQRARHTNAPQVTWLGLGLG